MGIILKDLLLMWKKLTSPSLWSHAGTDWAALILRLTLGVLMIKGHGWFKLMHVLEGDWQFGNPIGIGEVPSLFLAVGAEVGCSILLILGLWTRVAILPLIFTMLVIIFGVLLPMEAPWEKLESALHFLLPYLALFYLGSGKFSVDYLLKKDQ